MTSRSRRLTLLSLVLLYTETKDPDAVARNYGASGGMFVEEAIQDGIRYTLTYLYREYDAGQDLSTFWADLLQAKDPVITPNKRNQLWYDRCGIAVAEKDGQYKVGIYIYDLGMETQNPDGTFTPVEDLPDIDVSAIPGEVCDAVMTQLKDSGAAALPKRDNALDQAAAMLADGRSNSLGAALKAAGFTRPGETREPTAQSLGSYHLCRYTFDTYTDLTALLSQMKRDTPPSPGHKRQGGL